MKSKILLTIFVFLTLPLVTLADECDGFDPTCGDGIMDTPLDSWLIVLLAAGAVYGWIRHRRKQAPATK